MKMPFLAIDIHFHYFQGIVGVYIQPRTQILVLESGYLYSPNIPPTPLTDSVSAIKNVVNSGSSGGGRGNRVMEQVGEE